ncbi:MAG TPA: sigma 54-interacting transcriptional regulator [Polyangiaceae bacterium]|nr:sigma 54-interacting transcriptional regulator [Polyangiaceae bacterium]
MPPGNDSTAKLSTEFFGYEILVTGAGSVSIVPLPENGELSIGRAEDATLRLTSNSVSRRHARLRVHGADLSLEDFGSANGTLLNGERVPAQREIPVQAGQTILIGDFALVLRTRRAAATTRHIWSSEYFEARIEEQCERSRDAGSVPFHLLKIGVEAAPSGLDVPALIAQQLKSSDLLARLAESVFGVLLLEDSESSAGALGARVERALKQHSCRAGVEHFSFPRDGTSASSLMGRILGSPQTESDLDSARFILRSPAMVALYQQIEPVARTHLNVLILGETGVGKDVLARNIHERSERRDGPFLRLNCAALPEQLLESELFGHEKGAFTGATHQKPGLLVSAAGGSVFLDEIGELPQRLQPKLLQVLETHEILSVGSVKPRRLDVRFIAASNRDLEVEAAVGDFRSDLYYRLAGFTALIPPLRERREDILPLAREFIRHTAAKLNYQSAPPIRDEAASKLLDYAWPGNVRELRNVVERALVLAGGRPIGPEHLPLERMRSVVLVAPRNRTSGDSQSSAPVLDLTPKELAERERILEALTECAGNQSKAAERLGISRSTLVHRLDAYRIGRPRKRPQ